MQKEDIILGQLETYQASSAVWSFKRVDDIVNGVNLKLSNMVGGFPFEYAGKRFYKTPNKKLVRSDFNSFRLQWILHCVGRNVRVMKSSGNYCSRYLLT